MKTETKKRVEFVVAGTFRQVMGSFLIDRRSRGVAKGTLRYYDLS